MSIRKSLPVIGLALLAATPFVAHAGAGSKATKACVQAFVDTYVPHAKKVNLRISEPPLRPLTYAPRKVVVALSAHLPDGTELATARCVANVKGDVMVLDNPPPSTYLASADFVVGLK